MRKIFLKSLLIALWLSQNVFSQKLESNNLEWAPIGSQWFYSEPYQENLRLITLESIGDTLIKGRECRIIKISRNNIEYISLEFISQSGDSLFYYNSHTEEFHLLYDFSAKIGDTIKVHTNSFLPTLGFLTSNIFGDNETISSFEYRIVNIDSIMVSDKWLKRQEVDYLDYEVLLWGFLNSGGENSIIEGIGSLSYFFGMANLINPEQSVALLRCYQDSSLDYHNPNWEADCSLVSSIMESFPPKRIKILPNPVIDHFIIDYDNLSQVQYVQIIDANGRIRLSYSTPDIPTLLNIKQLAPGLYFIKVVVNNNSVLLEKIIKL